MADQQEQFNTLVLSRIGFYNLAGILEVYRRVGSATAIMEQHRDIRSLIPEASPRLVEAFQHIDSLQRWAEAELKWAGNNGIHVLCLNDECYPQRLSECCDAPLVLFYQAPPTSIAGASSALWVRDVARFTVKTLSVGSQQT